MSMKRLKQKMAAALIVAMTAASVLPAAAAIGTPSKDNKVTVTFVGGEGGSWTIEETGPTASGSDASPSNGSIASPSDPKKERKIERTYDNLGEEWKDDDGNYFVNLEYIEDNDTVVQELTRDSYHVKGWYSDDVYVGIDTQIYNGATLTAKWESNEVKEPVINLEGTGIENADEIVVSGLESGDKFSLKGIDLSSEKAKKDDEERMDTVDYELNKMGLKKSSKNNIMKLDIHVDFGGEKHEVTITLPVPKWGFDKEKNEIWAIHFKEDGMVETIRTKTDDEWKLMTFTVKNGFSPFYIVMTEKDEDIPTPPSGGSSGGGGSHGSGGSSSASYYTMHGTWVADGNGWKFRKDSGEYATNTWGLINGKWYYFDAQGKMVTMWYQIGGQWYYMDPTAGADQGVMKTGWLLDPTYNAWFYLNANGAMAIGWQQINGVWYYLNPVSDGTKGAMAADTYVDGYYVNANGAWVQ